MTITAHGTGNIKIALKTGIAGDVLQKFSNYRVRLVIVGGFSKYPGTSIRDFIYESNKGMLVNFLDSNRPGC